MTADDFERELMALVLKPSSSEFLEIADEMYTCLIATALAVRQFKIDLANEVAKGTPLLQHWNDESKKA